MHTLLKTPLNILSVVFYVDITWKLGWAMPKESLDNNTCIFPMTDAAYKSQFRLVIQPCFDTLCWRTVAIVDVIMMNALVTTLWSLFAVCG